MGWKFWREDKESGATFNAQFNLSSNLADAAEYKTLSKVVEKAAEAWIEEHGAELLKRITPEAVEERVKKTLAERVLKTN